MAVEAATLGLGRMRRHGLRGVHAVEVGVLAVVGAAARGGGGGGRWSRAHEIGDFPLSLTGQEDKALGLGWLEREVGWAPYVDKRESAGESVRWQRKFWPDDWA